MSAKISIIGAGSASFSLSLIRDICLTPNLQGSTVSFMDIDQERLDAAHILCQRYAREVGTELKLEKTTNRRASLQGADFVINTALVVGNRRLYEGMKLAQQHGYRFGGSYHIMHDEPFWANFYQFRLFESVIEDALEICPEAWHLLVANPVLAGITYLTRKYPRVKIVGLCHGFRGIYYLASALGLDGEGLTFEIPGVNHFVWLTHLCYNGEDVYPMLDHWIEHEAPKYWKIDRPGDQTMCPKAVDLYKRFGVFPIGDTCTPGGGSWPWWYHTDTKTEKRWKEDPEARWQGHFKNVESTAAWSKRIAADDSIKLTDEFPREMSGEVIIPVIESIACDIPRVIIANIQNSGDFVPGIPRDFEVEIPTLVSRRGIQGIQTSGLPEAVLAYALRDRVAPVNLELEAYEQGDKALLLQLIMMDPWTRTEQQARGLLEAILVMPGNKELRDHYK